MQPPAKIQPLAQFTMSESLIERARAYIYCKRRSYMITTSLLATAYVLGSPWNLVFIAFRIVGIFLHGIIWAILLTKTFLFTSGRLKYWVIDKVSAGVFLLTKASRDGGANTLTWMKHGFNEWITARWNLVVFTMMAMYFLWFALGSGGATLACLLATPIMSVKGAERRAAIALGASLAAVGSLFWTWVQVTLIPILISIPENGQSSESRSQTPADSRFQSPLLQLIKSRTKGFNCCKYGLHKIRDVSSAAATKVFYSKIPIMDQIVRLVQKRDRNLEFRHTYSIGIPLSDHLKTQSRPTRRDPRSKSFPTIVGTFGTTQVRKPSPKSTKNFRKQTTQLSKASLTVDENSQQSEYPHQPTYDPLIAYLETLYDSEIDFELFEFEDASTISTGVEENLCRKVDEAIEFSQIFPWSTQPMEPVMASGFWFSTFWLIAVLITALVLAWLFVSPTFLETILYGTRRQRSKSTAPPRSGELWPTLCLLFPLIINHVLLFSITKPVFAILNIFVLVYFCLLATSKSLKLIVDAFLYFFPQSIQESASTLLPGDVTVVVNTTTTDFSAETDLERTLLSILSNQPRRMILSTVLLANQYAAEQLCRRLSTSATRIDLTSTANPNQLNQMAALSEHIRTPITCYVEDNIIWTTEFLRHAVSAFEDSTVGIVEAAQRGVRVRGDSIRKSWANFKECAEIEKRNWEKMASWKLNGGVSVISGKTICMRTEIISSPAFTDRTLERRHWHSNIASGGAESLTRHCVDMGWKIAFLSHREALVYVVPGVSSPSTNPSESWSPSPRIQTLRRPIYGFKDNFWWTVIDSILSLMNNRYLSRDIMLFVALLYVGRVGWCLPLARLLWYTHALKLVKHLSREPRDFFFFFAHSSISFWFSLVKEPANLQEEELAASVEDAAARPRPG